MKIINLIDRMKLFFRKDKELYSSMYNILGFYPHNISFYRIALTHKSMGVRIGKGKSKHSLNNERLEFLGDAILEAVASDIVFHKFQGKDEGFLTNTRSKLVQRKMLNKLSAEFGIDELIVIASNVTSHNTYLGGNALEALIGAVYLDRGYAVSQYFITEKLFNSSAADVEKVAESEINFKSKLIEWGQKNKLTIEFTLEKNNEINNGSQTFVSQILIENIVAGEAKGYSKKECHQIVAKEALERLRKEPQFVDRCFKVRANRIQRETKENEKEYDHSVPRVKRKTRSNANDVNKAISSLNPEDNNKTPTTSYKPRYLRTNKEPDLSDMPTPTNVVPKPSFPIEKNELRDNSKKRESIIQKAEEEAFKQKHDK